MFEAARPHLTSTKTRLITDASRLNGIGFVLKQEIDGIWKPVQEGSIFLTETEGKYTMVELELLAICWAAKKCANFSNGLPLKLFKILTDHASLIPILNKYTLPKIENKRLQRLKAKLDHLQFHAVWIKRLDNTEADVLSRIPHRKARKEEIIEDETTVSVAMVATLDLFEKSNINYTATPLRDERLLELQQHQDQEYKMLKTAIIKQRSRNALTRNSFTHSSRCTWTWQLMWVNNFSSSLINFQVSHTSMSAANRRQQNK
jgi:hypothetical protein